MLRAERRPKNLDLRKRGTLRPADQGKPDEIAGKIKDCTESAARLSGNGC